MDLKHGAFVRVKQSEPLRGGKDGMVVADFGDFVALLFGWDRHCQPQHCQCVGPEMWDKSDLDLSTVE